MDSTYTKQTYKCDSQVYIWSAVYTFAILMLIIGSIDYISQWWVIAIIAVVTLMTLFFVASLPRAFEITDDAYIVHLLMYKVRFKKSEYTATPVTKSVLKDSVRTFATGGAYGYTGYWWSPEMKMFYSMFVNPNEPLLKLTRKSTTDKKAKTYLVNGRI